MEPESCDTGARGQSEGERRQLTAQYLIIFDINISDPSVTTINYLPELGFEDGKWTIRDPRWPGDLVCGHTQERPRSLQVITVPVTGNVEDMIINIESHASSISTDVECVLERALSDRDWLEPELRTLCSLSSEPGLDKRNLAILS